MKSFEVKTGDIFCSFRYLKSFKKPPFETSDYTCPVCEHVIKEGDEVYLVITNGAFPNRIIHRDCTDPETYDQLVTMLMQEWQDVKKAAKK